jgi:hypothetical protein
MASKMDCVSRILQTLPKVDQITYKKDIERLVSRMSKEKANAFTDSLLSPDAAYRKKAMKLIEEERYNIKVERLKALDNLEKRKDVQLRFDLRENKREAMSNLLVGDHKLIGENRLSVAARQSSLQANLHGLIAKEIDGTGLSNVIRSGELDRQIRIELSELNKGELGNFGVSNSKEAMVAAKAFQKIQKTILGTLNGSGAYIRELSGYAGRVSHNADKLLKIGKEQWVESILPLLDLEKTFNSGVLELDPIETLSTIYDDITTGQSSRRKPPDLGSDQVIRMLDMPPNFASRSERSRVLHFQDAAAEHDYLKNFGNDSNMLEEMIGFASRAAKDSGLMQVFGTNPGAGFAIALRSAKIKDRGMVDQIQKQFLEVSGETLRAGQSIGAQIGAAARAWNTVTKLGGAMISSVNDLANRTSQLINFNGENYFTAWGKTFQSSIDALNPKTRKDATYLMGVASDAYISSLQANLSGGEALPGYISKSLGLFYKLNLQGPWTQINKQAQGMVLAADVGMRVNQGFNALDESFVNNFKRFGIREPEWNFIRNASEVAQDGRSYVGFQNVFDMDDDMAVRIAKESGLIPTGYSAAKERAIARKMKFDAATKLSVYYNDQVATAMLDPGARERAILLQGTHQDTAVGQALRLFAQFKMFPTSMITQSVQSTLYAKGATSVKDALIGPNSNKTGVVRLMADLTVLAYGGMVIKDLFNNKTPKDPRDPKTMQEAFLKGGVGGVFGDLLIQDFDSRYGRGALSFLAGPTFGQLDDIANLKTDTTKYLSGDRKKAPTGAYARIAKNNIPGGNLFYTKAAIDHFFLYYINEKITPGSVARMEARMRKNGQKPLIGAGE